MVNRRSRTLWLIVLSLGQDGQVITPINHYTPKHLMAVTSDEEAMQLDDTRDKIYIHDLERELQEVESDEEKVIFLPDIEKKLAKIPKSVLTSRSQPVTSNEMILYNVPSSISVPREQDNVRRAIIESRARVREQQEADRDTSRLLLDGRLATFNSGLLYDRSAIAEVEDNVDKYDDNAMDLG